MITFLNGSKKEKSAEMIEKACGLANAVNFPWASLTIWGDSHSGTRQPPTYSTHIDTHTNTHSVVSAWQYSRNLWEEARLREDDWQVGGGGGWTRGWWEGLSCLRSNTSSFFHQTGRSIKSRTLLKRVKWHCRTTTTNQKSSDFERFFCCIIIAHDHN